MDPNKVLLVLKEALARVEADNKKGKLHEDSLREAIAHCEQDIAEGKKYGDSEA